MTTFNPSFHSISPPFTHLCSAMFPGGSDGRESACNAGDPDSTPLFLHSQFSSNATSSTKPSLVFPQETPALPLNSHSPLSASLLEHPFILFYFLTLHLVSLFLLSAAYIHISLPDGQFLVMGNLFQVVLFPSI